MKSFVRAPVSPSIESSYRVADIYYIALLSRSISDTLKRIHYELQMRERVLRAESTTYSTGLICTMCRKSHPETAKKCHSCKNSQLLSIQCDTISRVSGYFDTLARHGLWPFIEPSETCALSTVIARIQKAAQENNNEHKCAAKKTCPLTVQFDVLAMMAQKFTAQSVNVLTLSLEKLL